jgi:Disulphide bond corrector protein DsbC
MRRKNYLRLVLLCSLTLSLLSFPASFDARKNAGTAATITAVSAPQPSITINGFFATDKAQRGRTIQAAVVMEIPRDFHVNSNRPLGKYVRATSLKLSAVSGIKIGPVTYPRGVTRKFAFSEEQLSVYEGRVVMRFNITIPPDFPTGVTQITARLSYQSCSNEVCFQPDTRSISMPIAIVGPTESVKRINGNIFGGRRG